MKDSWVQGQAQRIQDQRIQVQRFQDQQNNIYLIINANLNIQIHQHQFFNRAAISIFDEFMENCYRN